MGSPTNDNMVGRGTANASWARHRTRRRCCSMIHTWLVGRGANLGGPCGAFSRLLAAMQTPRHDRSRSRSRRLRRLPSSARIWYLRGRPSTDWHHDQYGMVHLIETPRARPYLLAEGVNLVGEDIKPQEGPDVVPHVQESSRLLDSQAPWEPASTASCEH